MGSLPPGFHRAVFDLTSDKTESTRNSIRSLPDLILHNAVYNPQKTFCLQAKQPSKPGEEFEFVNVSFLELALSVERCCNWILNNIDGTHAARIDSNGCVQKCKPVALLLESDLTLFVYLAALLTLNIPVSSSFLHDDAEGNTDLHLNSVFFFLSDSARKPFITFWGKLNVI